MSLHEDVAINRWLRYLNAYAPPRVTTALLWRRGCYAAFAFASWIARQTRSGVSGMSMCLTP